MYRRPVYPVIASLLVGALGSQSSARTEALGERIAFASDRSGDFEIYSMSPDGSDVARLTNSPGRDASPAFAPGATEIAFESDRDGTTDIWLMGAGGSSPQNLTSGPGRDEAPTFSPDGTRIAFTSYRDSISGEIYVMNREGTGQVRLTSNDSEDDEPAFSSDSQRIAFTSDRTGNLEIFAMADDGSGVVNLTNHPAADQAADLSPVGDQIAFASDRAAGNHDIWSMAVDGSAPVRLTEDAGVDTGPSWSPDGQMIAFQSDRAGTARRRTDGSSVVITDKEGLEEVVVTDDGGNETPDWGDEETCQTYVTEGWFEPTQGVWQDDPHFADQAGKQLRFSSMTGGNPHYTAELPMVKDRRTVLTGIDHSVGGPSPKDRANIVIKGFSNCSEAIETAFELDLMHAGVFTILWKSPALQDPLPISGDPLPAYSEWSVRLPAAQGVPPTPNSFTFGSTGPYIIRAELARADTAPGTGYLGHFVQVDGTVVETSGPKTLFLPLIIAKASAAEAATLLSDAQRLAQRSSEIMATWFPIPEIDAPGGGLPFEVAELQRIPFTGKDAVDFHRWVDDLVTLSRRVRGQIRIAQLDQAYRGFAELSSLDRILAVVTFDDFDDYFGNAAGVAVSRKVAFVTQGSVPSIVAHELTHMLPFGSDEVLTWAETQMKSECLNGEYHNDPFMPVAHGFQVRSGTSESRRAYTGDGSYMGEGHQADQCTFWHLSRVLQAIPDPPVLYVQGRLARKGNRVIGRLLSSYSLDGTTTRVKRPGGRYAIVLRNKSGRSLGRYPFIPKWDLHGDPIGATIRRSVLTFGLTVPDPSGVARIDLVYRKKTLDRIRYSARPPTVRITAPAGNLPAGTSITTVRWVGKDRDRNRLRYSVLYSPDGGQTWLPRVFEQRGRSAAVTLDNVSDHLVKVIANDGTRSTEAIVSFSTV